jgi:hypothetical protein
MDTGNRHNCKTVTNDIEWVLEKLNDLCDIQHKRIFYMDSEGHIDEVLHKETLLTGFKAGHEGVNL